MILVIGGFLEMITDTTFFFLPSALTFVLLVGYIFKLGDFFSRRSYL